MPSTPNRTRSLSIAKSAANTRRLQKTRLQSLIERIAVNINKNKLPAHLKSPSKKNKGKK